MTNRKRPYRFSEETRQLDAEKSGLLFYARERAAANDSIESARVFAKAAQMEEEIAIRLEAEGYPPEAMISWVSAASCYFMAHDFAQALRVCELAEDKPFVERYQDILQQIQTECETHITEPIVLTGDSDSARPNPMS